MDILLKLFGFVVTTMALAAVLLHLAPAPLPCPEELRPAVYDRSWPADANPLTCEHALMTGQPLGKECA